MEIASTPITDDRIQQAYDYWRRIAAGRAMPARKDLDPVDIPRLLPYVMLVEVEGPGRFRYRLIGTAIAQEQGVNATGRYVGEAIKNPEYRVHGLSLYEQCVRERRPIYSESLFLSSEDGAIERHTKAVFLPLSDDGAAVDRVFVAQVFHYVDRTTRDQHFLRAQPFKNIVHVVL
jgi:hypothetical protein